MIMKQWIRVEGGGTRSARREEEGGRDVEE